MTEFKARTYGVAKKKLIHSPSLRSANVHRRATSAMGEMYRRRSKLLKNLRIGEIFLFFKNDRILLKIQLKVYLDSNIQIPVFEIECSSTSPTDGN